MGVKNALTEKQTTQVMTYMANGVEVKLTPETVKNYLVSGDAQNVTTQELVMFMNICKFNGLNPWLKEAYCVKYGNSPATMVTGRTAFEKRAEEHPQYDGMVAGVVVENENGEIIYRKGAILRKNEVLLGGFAEVWRKDRSHSYYIEVGFEEYAGRKKDGSLNGQWMAKPATMIRKVALVQALREAFPKSMFDGMNTPEEVQDAEVVVTDARPTPQPETYEAPKETVQNQTPQQTKEQPEDNLDDILFGGN